MRRVIQQFFIIATIASLSYSTTVTATGSVDNVISQSTHIRRCETTANRQLDSVERIEFILYNAENNQFLTPLVDNSWMSITQWGVTDPSSLNIQLRVHGSSAAVASVASVQFNLDDGLIDRADGGSAKFMCGNAGENVYKCPKLTFGKHKLTATLFSGPRGSGTDMGTYSVNFEFLGGGGSDSDPAPVPAPTSLVRIPAPVEAQVALDLPIDLGTTEKEIPASDFTFTLLNADTNLNIIRITDGMTIDLAKYNQKEDTPLSIEAVYTKSNNRGYKKFNLNNGQHVKVDAGDRTFLCGNEDTEYLGCPDLKVSSNAYTLETTMYTFGKELGTAKITFNLIYSTNLGLISECSVPKFAGEFEPLAEYPIEIAESMGAMIGDDFVIVSGFFDGFDGVTKDVYALKTTEANATWRLMDPVPTDQGFSHAAYSVKDNVMYACGAYVGPTPGPDSPICLKYNHVAEKGKQWSFLPNLPEGRGGGSLHYLEDTNSLMFSTGALRRDGRWEDKTNVWELLLDDIDAGWKDLPPIPYTGNHIGHVKVSYNGLMRYYTVGGQETSNEGEGNKVDNYEWDNIGRQWIKHADMPFPRGHISASTVPYGCGFIIAGGAINGEKKTADVTYYSIDTDSYTSIGNLPREVNTPVCDMVYLPTGNYLYCISGPFARDFSWRILIE